MTSKTNTVLYKHKKYIFRILLLALTAFYCTLPLFIHQGLPYVDDMSFHVFQADQFSQTIDDGLLYPRWVLGSNDGYGSPNFVFYSPLSYYFVSIVKFFTSSLIGAMIIAVWCSFFLSGITMFVTTGTMFGGSRSLLPAIIYQILPYHLFDIYIRGTFVELFAFIWFPLIILFLHKMIESRNKNAVFGLSISYAGLILTHLVSGFIFTFVIGAYLFYHSFLLKKIEILIKTSFSLILGLGLSSIYLIPVIFERRFVQIEYLVKCHICDYKKNFLFMLDKFQAELWPFYITLHAGVLLETILFIFIVLLIRKNRQILSNRPQQNFFIFLFIFVFFLTIPLSRPIWGLVPRFPFLQFPWRWVSMMELSLCFLIGSIFYRIDMHSFTSNNLRERVVMYLIITLFVVSPVIIFKSVPVISSNIQIKSLSIIEYNPIWATNIEKIMLEEKNDRVSVVSGKAVTKINEWKSERRVISIEAFTPSLLRISTFYYPGWEAGIDDNRIQIKIEKESGAMLIYIPKGEHTLELKFVDTSVRYYAKLISLFSMFSLILLSFFLRKN